MNSSYPRGSEWRKWDLHLHAPGSTIGGDGYKSEPGKDSWDIYCQLLEESDVEVFGITNYFSFESYFVLIEKFFDLYPESTKRFFPNVELRLNETVNDGREEVNIHLIFNPSITLEEANEFMRELKTENTNSSGKQLSCSELKTKGEFESAVVSRKGIASAFKKTFGEKAIRHEHMIVVTAANNDGIRPTSGQKRKMGLTDEIDKFSDAFFGGSGNTSYYLDQKRLQDKDQKVRAKPVFAGSDAHTFNQFNDWVGKSVKSTSTTKEVTWIKADKNFNGLLQTLIEPEERVSITSIKPDSKDLYKVIESVTFSGSKAFPEESVLFNQNLTSIIGSRSSGKSALLSYISYAINPEETITRQLASQEGLRREDIGPAAGITWRDVANISCEVKWASGTPGGGKVIYLPQNYLFSISNRPAEITQKVVPVLFKNYPDIKAQYDKTTSDIEALKNRIETSTSNWFDSQKAINTTRTQIKEIGSKVEIEKERDGLQNKIDDLKKKLSMTDEDVKNYQTITEQISNNGTKIDEITEEINSIQPFITGSGSKDESAHLEVTVSYFPSIESLPTELGDKIKKEASKSTASLAEMAQKEIVTYLKQLKADKKKVIAHTEEIIKQNKELIEKNKRNDELAKLVDDVNKQNTKLGSISEKEASIQRNEKQAQTMVSVIEESIERRTKTLADLDKEFSNTDQSNSEILFGVEFGFDLQTGQALADRFNRQFKSSYIQDASEGIIDIEAVRNNVGGFLSSVSDGSQALKHGASKEQAAKDILSATEEIRFNATLEDDKIGGFALSSMTPGKRALFALTLILNETEGGWPLLIDQPEDDLDSRSIYAHIVPYIMERKRERQIIMVSHDANLVVGADSEEVIVANKHGDDRKNRNNTAFRYLTGALEDSKPKDKNVYILESCGIREHACEILDGGEEAFEKRRDKYGL